MPSQHGFVGRPIGQHEPLTVRLRNLIQGYPKGLGIVKEFLQNADDAGATTVQIVMDWRHHSASRLPAPALDRLTTPQFSCAQRLAEAYWLYVVEFADTLEARIHRIQNPAGRSSRFYFARGWIGVREEDV